MSETVQETIVCRVVRVRQLSLLFYVILYIHFFVTDADSEFTF